MLAGPGFALRPFRPDDFAAARALEDDEAAARWVPPLPGDDGAAVSGFYEECRAAGEMLCLVVADPADDAYLGETMLVVGDDRVVELGIGLTPAARGRGIAAAALRLFTEWALGSLDVGRAQVLVSTENPRALRLSERAGFRHEGVLRGYRDGVAGREDVHVLSRLPGDPAPDQA